MKKLTMQEMDRISSDEFKAASKINVEIILENIRSMMNIGSVFRSADAFRIKKIWLCGITATPPHREIHKTALGATESVEWEYFEKCPILLRKMNDTGIITIAVEQLDQSISLEKWRPKNNKPYALVFGNEINGVTEESLSHCRYGLEIPQFGTKHSLNISVTAGIVMWEAFKKFKKK